MEYDIAKFVGMTSYFIAMVMDICHHLRHICKSNKMEKCPLFKTNVKVKKEQMGLVA